MKSRYGLEIRAAASADAPGLVELFGQAGRVVPARVLSARLDVLRQQPGTVLIAVEWGPPSGVIAARWCHTLEADAPLAQVTTLLVGPDGRRRGIGRMLLKAASQAARAAGCDDLVISVDPGQADLRAFCQASGFLEGGGLLTRALRKKT